MSVIEEELSSNFKLFPNPSNGEVTITFGTSIYNIKSLSIKNSLGQQVKTFNNFSSQSFKFSTNSYSKGIYFIEAIDKQGSKSIKKLLII